MSDVAVLPVSATTREHNLGPRITVPASMSLDKFERVERVCLACGMVRITVLGRPRPREWKTADGKLWRGPTPVCRVPK